MNPSVTLPFFIKTDDDGNIDAQINLLYEILVFDEHDVAQRKKEVGSKSKLQNLSFLYVGEGLTLVYSPLFLGRNLKAQDETVHNLFFDYTQKQFQLKPSGYLTPPEMRAYTKNGTLPTHLPWEKMEENIPILMQHAQQNQWFDVWLAQHHKQMIEHHLNEHGVPPNSRTKTIRKI